MSAATAKYGILVGVDGSAQSNAAVAWAAREAVMRQLPITLLHIVAPVVVGWPVGQLYANMTEWQKDNAQQVIEQAREALTNSLGESKPPQV
ncbi:universal stress protein, partial [Mycobacterium tuberculosis]